MIVKLLLMLSAGLGVLGFASTAGAIATVAASFQDYTQGGGVQTKAYGTGVSGAQLVSGAPGRLQAVLVTTSATATWTLYDTTNVSSQTGATIIGYIPASTDAGTVVRFQMPAAKGIVAVPSAAGTAITVSFN